MRYKINKIVRLLFLQVRKRGPVFSVSLVEDRIVGKFLGVPTFKSHLAQEEGFRDISHLQNHFMENNPNPIGRIRMNQSSSSELSSIQGSEKEREPGKTKGVTATSDPNAEIKALYDRLQILPKRSKFKGVNLQGMPQKVVRTGKFFTNFYEFDTTIFDNTRKQNIFTYKVTSRPPIRADASSTWASLIRSFPKRIKEEIKFITFRGDTLWAFVSIPSRTFPVTLGGAKRRGPKYSQQQQYTQQYPQEQTKESMYEVTLQCKNRLLIENIFTEADKDVRGELIQLINNKIKENLREASYEELGKGRFYKGQQIGNITDNVIAGGLKLLKGFKFSLVCLAPQKIWLQIDRSTRILRTRNMHEQLLAQRDTPQAQNLRFKGAIVVARYGNYKTYVIDSIDYNLNPDSTFEIKRGQDIRSISYKQYYESMYHVTIKNLKQPLIVALASVQQEIKKGRKLTKKVQTIMLVPELVSLTGLDREQRQNQALMQEVANKSRSNPQERVHECQKLITLLKKNKDLNVGQCVQIQGSVFPAPLISVQGPESLKTNPYSMEAPSIKLPIKQLDEKDMIVFYSERSIKGNIVQLYQVIREASKTLAIRLPEEPKMVQVPKDHNLNQQTIKWGQSVVQMVNQVSIQDRNRLILVFFFDDTEKSVYDNLKQGTIRKLQVKSQAILTSSFSKVNAAMSVAGKIGLQILAKYGLPLWEVQQRHPYWGKKGIAISSMSYSRSMRGQFTVAMVGSTNRTQTKIYNYCQTGLQSREAVSLDALEQFYNHWIWEYYQNEKKLPDTLVIYREGLSDSQLKRNLATELNMIESVVGGYSGREINQYQKYEPEIVFLTVNKKVNSRFYRGNTVKQIYANPEPGSVIYNQLASNDLIDFYLVPQTTEVGTASPCQYRLIYYHPQGQPFPYDHSKTVVPLEAIALLTYEQCYNYYNWTGAVRLPATLQYTRKLSKLAGEHIQKSVNRQFIQSSKLNEIKQRHPELSERDKKRMVESSCRSILSSYYFL